MRYVILLMFIAPAYAGLFGPDVWPFVPVTHPDGSKTWTITYDLKSIPKADMALPKQERDIKLAGVELAFHKFCEGGWQITDSREEKKRLIIEGKCLVP